MILLLAPGWLLSVIFRGNDEHQFAGFVSLGCSILSLVAIGRWYSEFSNRPQPTVSRYLAAGHYANEAVFYCLLLDLALAVCSIILLVPRRAGLTDSPAALELPQTSNSDGN